MSSISVLIYTYNSENDIKECIESAKLLTDTVIVADQNSSDCTAAIATATGAAVEQVPHHLYVEPVRMAGISAVKTDWVFILDADERLTKELAEEIKKTLHDSSQLPTTNYRLPRKNIFARKKWLEFGGWYPDHQIRLIKRSALKGWPKKIHAAPVLEGETGLLQQPILHFFHGDIEKMVNKTAVYEEIESGLLFDAKRQATTSIFFRKFLGELYRRLVKYAGWKDGMIGVIESFYQAYSKTVTYLFLYEKQ